MSERKNVCHHCRFRLNSGDAKFCGACGKPLLVTGGLPVDERTSPSEVEIPIALELRIRQLQPNSPCTLSARVRNLTDDRFDVEFSPECQQIGELCGHRVYSLSLRPMATCDFPPISFTASVGSHVVELAVDVAGRNRLFGYFELDICERMQNMVIHGPQIHNQGDYMIGDHSVTMNFNLADGQAFQADRYVCVPLSAEKNRPQIRKRAFGERLESGESRIVLEWKAAGRTHKTLLFGGTVLSFGRGVDVNLRTYLPYNEDPAEVASENISRSHGRLEFTKDGIRLVDKSRLMRVTALLTCRLSSGEANVLIRRPINTR